MSVQPSHQPGSTHQEDETLLETLISTPLAPTKAWQKPIVLRSLDEHRRYALKGYRLRTWVDHWLHHAERLFGVAALLIFIAWAVDGPIRDWWHTQQAERHAAPVQAALRATAVVRVSAPATPDRVVPANVPLPFTTPDMQQPLASEGFLAPRSIISAPEDGQRGSLPIA